MEKEEKALKDLFTQKTLIVESRKRMLEQSIQQMDKWRNKTENNRMELQQ